MLAQQTASYEYFILYARNKTWTTPLCVGGGSILLWFFSFLLINVVVIEFHIGFLDTLDCFNNSGTQIRMCWPNIIYSFPFCNFFHSLRYFMKIYSNIVIHFFSTNCKLPAMKQFMFVEMSSTLKKYQQ